MKKLFSTIAFCTMLIGILIPSADASFLDFTGIVDDASPELGGDLDVNGKTITSSDGSNVIIAPGGNTDFHVNATDLFVDTHPATKVGIGTASPPTGVELAVAGELAILETGSNPQYYTILQGGDQLGNITYGLPDNDGDDGDVLYVDSNKKLDWRNDLTGLTQLEDDATPTLGANLTVGGYEIVSDSGDVAIAPGGTGDFRVNTNDLFVEGTNSRVGIGTVTPTTTLDVAGTLKATMFYGDLSGYDATGNASYADALTTNATNCSAENAIRGINADGTYLECIPVILEADQLAQSYITGSDPTITTPTIVTSAQVPLVIGGTATGSSLTFQPSMDTPATVDIDMTFLVGNSGTKKAMTILSTGNVGINDTNPATVLSVVGSTSDSSGYGLFVTNSSDFPSFFVRNDGYVGAGTTTPQQFFSLQEDTDSTDVTQIARFGHYLSVDGEAGVGVGIEFGQETAAGEEIIAAIDAVVENYLNENGALVFSTMSGGATADEKMRISSEGKVGIGLTTIPSAGVHVLDTTEQLRLGYDSNTYFSATVDSSGVVTLDAEDAGSSEAFTFSDPLTFNKGFTVPAAGTLSSSRIENDYDFGSGTHSNTMEANGGITLTKDYPLYSFDFVTNYWVTDRGNMADVNLYDVDGDDDMDLILSTGSIGATYIYKNDGEQNFSTDNVAFDPAPGAAYGGYDTLTFGDYYDDDGDLDLIISYRRYNNKGVVEYFKNTASSPGSSNLEDAVWSLQATDNTGNFGQQAQPELVDWDHDGDLDLIAGHDVGGYRLHFWENQSSDGGVTPNFVRTSIDWLPEDMQHPSNFWLSFIHPEAVNFDGDDDWDLLVGNTMAAGQIWYFRNDSADPDSLTPTFTKVTEDYFGTPAYGYRTTPEIADVDGDGDLDAVIGDQHGRMTYFENSVEYVYQPTGTFTSQKITVDRDSIVYGTLSWNKVTPGGTTVKLQIRSDEDGDTLIGDEVWRGSNGAEGSYYTSSANIHSVHDGDKRIQYRVIMTTTNDAATPTFEDVTINFTYAADDLVLADSGNLGIGETSPSSTFDIGGLFQVNSSGTVTSGKWQGSQLDFDYGGTGFTSYAKGDMLYASSSSALGKISIGSVGSVLVSNESSVPVWSSALRIDPADDDNDYIGVGTATPVSDFHVVDGKYTQFGNYTAGVPSGGDCGSTTKGRIHIDITNKRFYICKGSAGWDYMTMLPG